MIPPFSPLLLLLGTAASTVAVVRGLKKKSLSKTGAVAAFAVGTLSVATGLRGFVLLFFYFIGSAATKHEKARKEARDATAAEGSQRGPAQVLACSALAVMVSLYHVWTCGAEKVIAFSTKQNENGVDMDDDDDNTLASTLACAVLAHHATCLADTLASELGMLSPDRPVLVTAPLRIVPVGTNGGVTPWGIWCSMAGGFLMGLSTLAMDYLSGLPLQKTSNLLVYSTICGLVGSWLDSLLGAVFQATYYDTDTKKVHHERTSSQSLQHISGYNILTHVQVNLVSIILTMAIGAWVLGPFVFQF